MVISAGICYSHNAQLPGGGLQSAVHATALLLSTMAVNVIEALVHVCAR